MSAGTIAASRTGALPFLWSLAAAVALQLWCYHADLPARAGVGYHHVASVRELAKGEFPPANNLVPGPIPVGHYGPYLVALGLAARLTGSEPLALLEAAGLLLHVLYLLLFRALLMRLVSPGAANWSVAAALLLWGPWPGADMPWVAWGWPGTTSAADPQNFFYPQHAALTLLAWLLLEVLGPPTHWRSLRLVVSAALLITTHPYTGFALVTALGSRLLALRWRRELGLRGASLLVLVPLLGLLVAAAWPYYPVWRLLGVFPDSNFRQPLPPAAVHEPASAAAPAGAQSAAHAASGDARGRRERAPARGVDWVSSLLPAWHVLGPALLGLAGAAVLARRGEVFLLVWSLGSLGLALCPWVPLRERLVTFAAMPLQLGAAAVLEGLWRRRSLGRVVVATLLLASGFVAWKRLEFVRDLPLLDLGFIALATPGDAVILAPDGLANIVAGQTGRKVVSPEGPDLFLILAGGAERMWDQVRFYGWRAGPIEREAILRRWRVTHVLVDRFAGFPGGQPPGSLAGERDGLALYDVRSLAESR